MDNSDNNKLVTGEENVDFLEVSGPGQDAADWKAPRPDAVGGGGAPRKDDDKPAEIKKIVALGGPEAGEGSREGWLFNTSGQRVKLDDQRYNGLHRGRTDQALIGMADKNWLLVRDGIVIDVQKSGETNALQFVDAYKTPDARNLTVTIDKPVSIAGRPMGDAKVVLIDTGVVNSLNSGQNSGEDTFAQVEDYLRQRVPDYDNKLYALTQT